MDDFGAEEFLVKGHHLLEVVRPQDHVGKRLGDLTLAAGVSKAIAMIAVRVGRWFRNSRLRLALGARLYIYNCC